MASIRDSTQNSTASGNAVTCTTPTGATTGDYLLAFVQTDLTGVALVDDSGDFGAALQQDDSWGASGAVFGMLLAGAPDADYTFSFVGTANPMLVALVAVQPGAGEVFDSVVSSEIVDATGASATITSAAVTVPATPSVMVIGFGNDANRTVATPPDGMTLAEFVDDAGCDMAVYSQVDVTPGSIQKSITWSSAEQMSAFAVALGFVVEGPTIDVQPASATSRLNGEASVASAFTMEYTLSGAWVSSSVEVNDGGGFDPLTIAGVYALSDNETDALTFTVTPTSKAAFNGLIYRITVEDENGAITSSEFTHTVLNGPVVTASDAATDGSGVGELSYHSDDPLTTDGECLLWTVEMGEETLYLVTRPAAP